MSPLDPFRSFVAAPADGRVNQKAVARTGPAPNSPSQLRQCRIGVDSDGAGHGGPAPLTLFALTLRGNRRRDGNPAILCETAEAE